MTTHTTEVERFTTDPENMRLFQQERVILETTELICQLLEEKGIRKADLAQRLGKSKAYVTQLLDGRTNMTLRTISDVMWALDSSLLVSASAINLEGAAAEELQVGYFDWVWGPATRIELGELGNLDSWLSTSRSALGQDMKSELEGSFRVWFDTATSAREQGIVGEVDDELCWGPPRDPTKTTLKLIA